MQPLHDRMPAIIHPDHYQHWLSPKEENPADLQYLLQPYRAEEMEADPVSTNVNSAKNEGPECWESPAKETLF
jgi:putative SOS response-associated peptidase YedK